MFYFFWESIKEGVFRWWGMVSVILGMGSFFMMLIQKAFPDKIRCKLPQSSVIIVLFFSIITLLISIGLGSYDVYSKKENEIEVLQKKNTGLDAEKEQLQKDLKKARKEKFASVQEMRQTYHEGQHISVCDMVSVRNSLVIKGDTFKHCDIYGPALVSVIGKGTILRCSFSGPLDSSFVVTTNKKITGAIRLADCHLIDCKFHHIGFIGNEEYIEGLKQKFH